MEINKPKATHTFRELLTEIGVVVIGVAIALAGEQTVEALRNHERAANARASIRAEIAYNLGQMEVRNATEGCVTKRLDEVDALIASFSAGKLPAYTPWLGRPITVISRDSQYKSASEAGNVSLLEDREQAAYAFLYSVLDRHVQAMNEEQKAWADLRALEKHPLPSPAMDALLHSAVQQARTERWFIEAAHRRAINAAAEIGIKPAWSERYNPASICLRMLTPRAEALKLVVKGRPGHFAYDEP